MDFEIIDEGSARDREIDDLDDYPAFIRVGNFKSQSAKGGSGWGNQEFGVYVQTYCPDRGWGPSKMVLGAEKWEPELINTMGKLGAFRPMPPAEKAIEAAVEELATWMKIKAQRVEIYDWYGDPEGNPACILHVKADRLSESQIKKINRFCPNWTKQVDQIQDSRSGRIVGGWLARNKYGHEISA